MNLFENKGVNVGRIRTIKPEFFRHLELYQAEVETGLPLRVAYAGLWTVADREGRFRWQPEVLKLDVLPFDDIDFSRVLDALLTRGFLVKYEYSGKRYGAIPTFKDHQFINNKELPSNIPAPDEHSEIIDNFTRDSRVIHAWSTRLYAKEGEREREKEKEINPPTPQQGGDTVSKSSLKKSASLTKAQESLFDRFWEAYPKKLSKGQAEKAWKSIKPDEQLVATMIATIERAMTLDDWMRDGGKFIPYPATWLTSKRWLDEPDLKMELAFDPNAHSRIEMFQTAKTILECDGHENFENYCTSKKLSPEGVMEWITNNST